MTHATDIVRPDTALCAACAAVGAATISAEPHRLDIRRAHLEDL